MTLHTIHERRLAQMPPPALRERKLHVVDPSPHPRLRAPVPHRAYLGRDGHALEGGVVAHALEEGDAEAGAQPRAGGQHAVRGAFADAVGERFEALADCHDEGAGVGGAVDPVAGEVLGLEARVRGHLEEVGRQHRVLVGADALGLGAEGGEGAGVGVFDDFELVLLVFVEEVVEGCGGEVERFRDEGGEGSGEVRHRCDVGGVGGPEGGEEGGGGPLIGGEEVVVDGGGGGGEGMGG